MPPPGTAPHAEVHCESLEHVAVHMPESARGPVSRVIGPVSRVIGPVSRGRIVPVSTADASGIGTTLVSRVIGPESCAVVVRPEPHPAVAIQSRSETVTTEMLASFMAVSENNGDLGERSISWSNAVSHLSDADCGTQGVAGDDTRPRNLRGP